MKRLLFALVMSVSACAQTAADKPTADAPAAPETWFTGTVDVGYRWRTDVAGSYAAYRSVVDLGEGPKLLGADLTLLDPEKRLFDRIEVRGQNWGDDPYTTLRVHARKAGAYEANVQYRNLAYFDFLPSFANPLLERGSFLNERAYDLRRRMTAVELDLRPGSTIVPFLGFETNSGEGSGVTTFVTQGNEYRLPDRLRDGARLYRGGLRFGLPRFHLTLEQGGTTFKDDQQVYSNGATQPGNRVTTLLGQSLYLSDLLQTYGVRAVGVYSRGVLAARPAGWLNLTGNFLYSQPRSAANYQDFAKGLLADLRLASFFAAERSIASATATLPRITGAFTVEAGPWRRVRVVQSWLTDRLHHAGSLTMFQTITTTSPFSQWTRLVSNYNQQETEVLFDLSRSITFRAGYRSVWGDASNFVLPVAGLNAQETTKLRQRVARGGLTFRPAARLSVAADAEGASSDRTYFRTTLRDYQRVSVRTRYEVNSSLSVSSQFRLWQNQNPAAGVEYEARALQSSLSLFWMPAAGKRFSFTGDYTRSTLRSSMLYLVPQTLRPEQFLYRDNAHLASGLGTVNLPGRAGRPSAFSFGGSLLLSSGSRPTTYFQPLWNASVPLSRSVAWISQWRYFGMSEAFYAYEGFRAHAVTTGLRFTR